MELPAGFWTSPSLARQAKTDDALRQIVGAKAALGSVMVDGSVLALVPDGFSRDETLWDAADRRPDTVIYFAGGYESKAARALAARTGLDFHYAVTGTAIRVATGRALTASSPLAAVLAPAASSE
jgi:hypothetical protein